MDAVEQIKRARIDAAAMDPTQLDAPVLEPLQRAQPSSAGLNAVLSQDPSLPASADASSAHRARDPLPGVNVLALPAELLLAILSALPVADLIRCRKVCRQWRAAVAAMAERDAKYAFRCGRESVRAQWAALKAKEKDSVRTRSNEVPANNEEEEKNAEERALSSFLVSLEGELVCACGRLHKDDSWLNLGAPPKSYAKRHAAPHPPLRWEVSAAEGALAAELAALAWPALRFADVLHPGRSWRPGALEHGWLPVWRALTGDMDPAALPKTHYEMLMFASAMFDHDRSYPTTPVGTFASRKHARAYYAGEGSKTGRDVEKNLNDWKFQRSLIQGARLVDLVLANGGAVAASYVRQATKAVAKKALDAFAGSNPVDPAALGRFAHTFCDGDTALAAQWERLARDAISNDPINALDEQAAAAAVYAISDDDWKDPVAWTVVPLPTAFAFPGSDSSVPLKDLFRALGQHVRTCLPLYMLSHRKLARRHGYRSWQLQQLFARQAAASWRMCCGLGWTKWLRERRMAKVQFPALGRKWVAMSDDAVQAFLDEQVAVADAVQDVLQGHLRMPVFAEVYDYVSTESNQHSFWLGGFSTNGNLVGTLTAQSIPHSYDSDDSASDSDDD